MIGLATTLRFRFTTLLAPKGFNPIKRLSTKCVVSSTCLYLTRSVIFVTAG